MRPVLWPYLLEFVVPDKYTRSLPIVCKSLATLAENLREEDDEVYDLDYDVLVNIPRPQELVARLIVLLGHPLDRGLGLHILHLFEGISPNLHEDIVDLWDEVIPRLTVRHLCVGTPHALKAVTYHEQSHCLCPPYAQGCDLS